MALSATQTRESQSAVQTALAQRQQKEELRRKQQEERERQQQEIERKLRLKHFDDQRREEERRRLAEQAEKATEAAQRRREDELRDALRYGPKKAKIICSRPGSPEPKWPTSSTQNHTREEVRRRRFPDEDDDDAPEFLTREEKRQRKQQQEMRKLFNTTKRSSHAGGYSKSGRRLPGGAFDVATTSQTSDANSASKSVKERLAAMPNTLTKLNVVKRDTRTIDEILQDRAKAKEGKVLDGDDAREFTDWFGSSKKEKNAANTPSNRSATNSGANSPSSRKCLKASYLISFSPFGSNFYKGSNSSTPYLTVSTSKRATPISKSSPLKTAPATSAGPLALRQKSADPSARPVSSNILRKTKSSKTSSNTAKSTRSFIPSDDGRSTASTGKKRSRSSSRSESPPPAKRRASSTDYRDEIWQILGRNRSTYVSMDVYSDDEDMEADATILEREEQQRFRFNFNLVMLSLTPCVLQRSHCQERGRACVGGGETSRGGKAQTKEGEGEGTKKSVIDVRLYLTTPCFLDISEAREIPEDPRQMSGVLVPFHSWMESRDFFQCNK